MIEYPPGTPSWVDLASPNLDESAAFYRELFGWEAADAGPTAETGGYRIFTLDGKQVGGLGPLQGEQPPHWNTYVAVADAVEAQRQVEAAGGKTLLEPMQVADAGTMAVFADPAGGAVFCVWQPASNPGAELVNQVGALTMNELDTRDPDTAARFYGEVFGWKLEPIDDGGKMVYGLFKLEGRLIAGLLVMSEGFPDYVPANWLPYFGVESLEESLARVRELGGSVLVEPRELDEGRFAAIADVHGAPLALWEGGYDPPPGAEAPG